MAGTAHVAKALAGAYISSGGNPDDVQVSVEGTITGMVGNHHIVSVGVIPAGGGDTARHGCADGGTDRDSGDVDAGVEMNGPGNGASAAAIGAGDIPRYGPNEKVTVDLLAFNPIKPGAGYK